MSTHERLRAGWVTASSGGSMTDIFKLLHPREEDGPGGKSVTLGIRVKIGDQEVDCPVSGICRSQEEWVETVASIQGNLEQVLEKGKRVLGAPSPAEEIGIQQDMNAREIWNILSTIGDEDAFVGCFNSLEEENRIEVAEHVLTACNVFSGRAATFSARYNSETALLE